MNNPVIYTAIYGSYDKVVPVTPDGKYRYVCFTDKPELIEGSGWEAIYSEAISDKPVRSAKIFKIKPHLFLENHDVSLWVDGNVRIKLDPEPLLTHCLKTYDMAMFDHYFINSLIGELNECIRCRKDDRTIMEQQVKKYLSEGFPQISHNHSMCTFIARRHNSKEVIKTMDKWWEEIESNSYRDQLSFEYSCWKTNFSCGRINAKWQDIFELDTHKGSL